MLDIMPLVQDVGVNLIFADLKIPKYFNILQSLDIWIANTGASNDGTAHNKIIMNLKKMNHL